MNTKELRKAFPGVRKEYFKDNLPVCNRCYYGADLEGKNIELHHIKALSDGGTNDFDNLIPLCFDCHQEWHCVEKKFTWEQFLKMPSYRENLALYTEWENIKEHFQNKPFQEGANFIEESIRLGRNVRKNFAETTHKEKRAAID